MFLYTCRWVIAGCDEVYRISIAAQHGEGKQNMFYPYEFKDDSLPSPQTRAPIISGSIGQSTSI